MINLRRGFRRLFLVLSAVWVAGTGLYLWRLAPPSPSAALDYDAIAADIGGVPTGAAHGPESLSVEVWEKRYKIPSRELDEVLRQLTPDERAAARDAFASSSTQEDLVERLRGMTLPKEVKARLWDLKAGRLARSSSWRDAPVILPTASANPAHDEWQTVSDPAPNGGALFDLDAALAREKAQRERHNHLRFRTFLEIGLLPPMIAFALLEGLLWAARGFSANKQKA
jgi:hypothetical protein